MTLFKNKFKVDSNRLKDWDYSNEGLYFITIVTKNRECIFGSIKEGKMILNNDGQIVENELLKSIEIRKNWFFHNWIVMPNHIHLLIEIQDIEIKNLQSDILNNQNIKDYNVVDAQQCIYVQYIHKEFDNSCEDAQQCDFTEQCSTKIIPKTRFNFIICGNF